METVLVAIGVLLAMGGVNVAWRARKARRRRAAVALAPGEVARLRAADVDARVSLAGYVPGGPSHRATVVTRVDLLLSDARLVVGSSWGPLVVATAGRPARVLSPGPGRLVIEGENPKGMAVRAELVVTAGPEWAAEARAVGVGTAPERVDMER
jgi:hypothetical protein